MKTKITVATSNDDLFRTVCLEQDIPYTCIEEGAEDNAYEIEYRFESELYHLGISLGLRIGHRIAMDTLNNFSSKL